MHVWAIGLWPCGVPQAVGPVPPVSSPLVRFGHGPTASGQTGATTLLTPGAFVRNCGCLDFPSFRRCLQIAPAGRGQVGLPEPPPTSTNATGPT